MKSTQTAYNPLIKRCGITHSRNLIYCMWSELNTWTKIFSYIQLWLKVFINKNPRLTSLLMRIKNSLVIIYIWPFQSFSLLLHFIFTSSFLIRMSSMKMKMKHSSQIWNIIFVHKKTSFASFFWCFQIGRDDFFISFINLFYVDISRELFYFCSVSFCWYICTKINSFLVYLTFHCTAFLHDF